MVRQIAHATLLGVGMVGDLNEPVVGSCHGDSARLKLVFIGFWEQEVVPSRFGDDGGQSGKQ